MASKSDQKIRLPMDLVGGLFVTGILKAGGIAHCQADEIKGEVRHLARSAGLAPYRPDAFRGTQCAS